ncbi:MAG: arsenic resistance protein [Coriobacteriia bacterium]|nr:arsenic resistance protein [Coriobacteriia bacterium]
MSTAFDSVAAAVKSLSKRLALLIPAAMVLGFVTGLLVDLQPLKAAVLPLTMLMVYPMLIDFRPSQALTLKDGKAVALAMLLDLAVLPVLAWGLALAFFKDQPGLFVGMVLAGLFPTSGMTISWTGFAKGNVGAAVKMTVIGLVLASVLSPLYLSVLAGKVVPVDQGETLKTVALVIGLPMALGIATRKLIVATMGEDVYSTRLRPLFPGVSSIGVLAIVFVAIGLKARMIASRPQELLVVLVPLVVFYGLNFGIATILGRTLLPRADAIAVVYGSVMRNLSIALGVAMTQFGPDAALVLAVAYIVQVQSAAWYVRLSDTVFGPAEAPAARAAA